ncbi:MAG TPA: secretin N-terminal domain-containing protein [Burkholderiales bacterium]|nr:secretin N-terminal domain-containing protein [Burkholderiales bacterium]
MSRFVVVFLLILAAGCAAHTATVEGRRLVEQGRAEEGIRRLEQGVKANPNDTELRNYYVRTRDLYVSQLLYEGEKARILGRSDEAIAVFRRVLEFSPGNTRAQAGLKAAVAEQKQRAEIARARALFDAGMAEQALVMLKKVLAENPSQKDAQALERRIEESLTKVGVAGPRLKPEFRKPVTLEFRDAPLKSVFEVLSRTSGINFVFDRDVRPDLKATIYVRDTSIEDAVNFLLVTSQLEKKVLNENTILIYPNLPNKVRDYQELVVKSFYLGNADVKQTLNLIKTVVKTRDVFIDERLNLLIMRDTPEAIRLAEKLIAAQDLAEPEVVLELEVLEVTRSKMQNLGIQYPSQIAAGIEGAAGPGQATLRELQNFNSSMVAVTITDPAVVINLKRQDGDTNLLANPRIRVKNREKAKIHIGDRLPVITTTSSPQIGTSESVQYLDVGLKLDVEPNVYLEDEVSMRVGLEVSNIVQEIRSLGGTLTYRIGTRNTATVLRLANGETQVLAGLIQDEDRRTTDKVPGLGDWPMLGRLFTSNNDNRIKTEIVLLITPYVVRNLDRPAPSALEVTSGTEGSLGATPMRLPSSSAQPRAQQQIPAQPSVAPAPPAVEGQSSAAVPPTPPVPSSPGVATPGGMQTVLLSAPLQAQAGREFALAVSVTPGAPVNVGIELVYDPAKLRAVGADGTPGRVQLSVAGTTAVRFQALEGQTGPAQISVASISATNAGGENVTLSPPTPVTVNITP